MKQITLYSDGCHKHNRFSIVNELGRPILGGEFQNQSGYPIRTRNQGEAEYGSLKRAIWLVSIYRKLHRQNQVKLIVKVDVQGMRVLNDEKPNSKLARWMKRYAKDKGVVLEIEWVKSIKNKADGFSRSPTLNITWVEAVNRLEFLSENRRRDTLFPTAFLKGIMKRD